MFTLNLIRPLALISSLQGKRDRGLDCTTPSGDSGMSRMQEATTSSPQNVSVGLETLTDGRVLPGGWLHPQPTRPPAGPPPALGLCSLVGLTRSDFSGLPPGLPNTHCVCPLDGLLQAPNPAERRPQGIPAPPPWAPAVLPSQPRLPCCGVETNP